MNLVRRIKHTICYTYMYLCNKIFSLKKKVVFSSFNGKTYSDNPKVITEALHQIDPDTSIVWMFKDPEGKKIDLPSYIKTVKSHSLKALYELATAAVWVDNFEKPVYLYKSRNQKYIQTYHGDRAFKKILYDVRTLLPNGHYKEGDLFEEKNLDLALSGSDYGDRHYRSAFNYKGEILKKGCPRNDRLINRDLNREQKIKETLSLDEETGVVLYAPTLRKSAVKSNGAQAVTEIDLEQVVSTLEESTNQKWVLLIRAHSAVGKLGGIPESVQYMDVSGYEDMNDLLSISDILITDYSSSAGDFALLNRLIILYQNDRKDYMEKDRALYFKMEDSPYLVAENQKELTELLTNYEQIDTEQNCKEILEFYGCKETGKAAQFTVEYIMSHLRTSNLNRGEAE